MSWTSTATFATPFGHHVAKFRSARTGLSVVIASLTGPLVRCCLHEFMLLAFA